MGMGPGTGPPSLPGPPAYVTGRRPRGCGMRAAGRAAAAGGSARRGPRPPPASPSPLPRLPPLLQPIPSLPSAPQVGRGGRGRGLCVRVSPPLHHRTGMWRTGMCPCGHGEATRTPCHPLLVPRGQLPVPCRALPTPPHPRLPPGEAQPLVGHPCCTAAPLPGVPSSPFPHRSTPPAPQHPQAPSPSPCHIPGAVARRAGGCRDPGLAARGDSATRMAGA